MKSKLKKVFLGSITVSLVILLMLSTILLYDTDSKKIYNDSQKAAISNLSGYTEITGSGTLDNASGLYKVTSSRTITGTSSTGSTYATSGLIIPENKDVTIYVASGKTLTVNGGSGNGRYGGGAGIELPSTSTLTIRGEGTVSAIGGVGGGAGNASYWSGSNSGRTSYTSLYTGRGGDGGNGGGSPGAGIGGKGNTAGSGGSGGAKVTLSSNWNDTSSKNGNSGGNGGSGGSGMSMGSLNIVDTVTVTVGRGTNYGAGSGGVEGYSNAYGDFSENIGLGSGGGAGGGGSSGTSATIGGSGGAGGGGGGGASGSSYYSRHVGATTRNAYYIFGGVGGGGGGNGGRGTNNPTVDYLNSTYYKSEEVITYYTKNGYAGNVGSSGGERYGGAGAKSQLAVSTIYSMSGGSGGDRGAGGSGGTVYVGASATCPKPTGGTASNGHGAAAAYTKGVSSDIVTVTYNANKGSLGNVPTSQIIDRKVASTRKLSSNTPTRTGYTFLGWSTNQNATTATYALSADYTGSTTTLYAVWKANDYKLTFRNHDNSGLSSPTASASVTYDSVVSSVTPPTKDKHEFVGYFTGLNGTGSKLFDNHGQPVADMSGYTDSSGNWARLGNVTLYEHWNVYNIVLSQVNTYDFGIKTIDYSTPDALNVTVTNTGNQSSGDLSISYIEDSSSNTSASFTLSKTTMASLGTNSTSKTGTFTVVPKSNLPAGEYSGAITVGPTDDNPHKELMEPKSFEVKFTVGKKDGVIPTGLDTVRTSSEGDDGKITGLDENTVYEYKKISEDTSLYKTVTGGSIESSGEITGLEPSAYHVRTKETNTHKESSPALVVVSHTFDPNDATLKKGTNAKSFKIIIDNAVEGYNYYLIDETNIIGNSEESAGKVEFNNVTENKTYKVVLIPKTNSPDISSSTGKSAIVMAGQGGSIIVPEYNHFDIPKLTSGLFTRPTISTATVTFQSSIPRGSYKYKVVNAGGPVPLDYGDETTINTLSNTISLTGLDDKSKDIYIIPYSVIGEVGTPIKVSIPRAYEIGLSRTGVVDFGTVTVNYPSRTPSKIVVSNKGANATGTLTVSLDEANTAFTVSPSSIGSITEDGVAEFTVIPKNNLDAGTYEDTVKVEGSNNLSVSINVKFVVSKGAALHTPVSSSASTIYSGVDITLDEYFNKAGDGTPSYTVTNGTGIGTIIDGKLRVTKAGSFTIKMSTPETTNHLAGGPVSTNLTVNKGTQNPPVDWTTSPESIGGANDGMILNLVNNKDYEIEIDNSGNFNKTKVTSEGAIEGLSVKHDYSIRFATTDLYNASGKSTTIKLEPPAFERVTLNKNGGVTEFDVDKYPVNDGIDLPSALKKGFSFGQWFKDKSLSLGPTMRIDPGEKGPFPLNLWAKFTENIYNVTVSDEITNGTLTVASDNGKLDEEIIVNSIVPDAGYAIKQDSLVYFKNGTGKENGMAIYAKEGQYKFNIPDYDVTVFAEFDETEERINAKNAKEVIKNAELSIPSSDGKTESEIKNSLADEMNRILQSQGEGSGISYMVKADDITINSFVAAIDPIPSKNGSYNFEIVFPDDTGIEPLVKTGNVILAEPIIDKNREVYVTAPLKGQKKMTAEDFKLSEPLNDYVACINLSLSPNTKGEEYASNTQYSAHVTLEVKGSSSRFDDDFYPVVNHGTVKNLKFHEANGSKALNNVNTLEKHLSTEKSVNLVGDKRISTFDIEFDKTESAAKADKDNNKYNNKDSNELFKQKVIKEPKTGDYFSMELFIVLIMLVLVISMKTLRRRRDNES